MKPRKGMKQAVCVQMDKEGEIHGRNWLTSEDILYRSGGRASKNNS